MGTVSFYLFDSVLPKVTIFYILQYNMTKIKKSKNQEKIINIGSFFLISYYITEGFNSNSAVLIMNLNILILLFA